MRTLTIAFVTVVLLASCGVVETGPPAVLWFDPADGETARHEMDIVVTADGNLSDAAFADLAKRLFLKTWPERTPVAATTVINPAGGGEREARLTATDALDDRWYVAGIDALPPHVVPQTRMPDGAVGARFRPGSHPRIRQISFCKKQDPAATALLIDFSEPITASAPPGGLVSVAFAGRAVSCVFVTTLIATSELVCPELASAASVTVSISAGFSGATGEPLPPGSWDIDIAKLTAGQCPYFSPPI